MLELGFSVGACAPVSVGITRTLMSFSDRCQDRSKTVVELVGREGDNANAVSAATKLRPH